MFFPSSGHWGATMAEKQSWNYECPHCTAKLLRRGRPEPPKAREQAFCPYCSRPLSPRDGANTLGYELVEPPPRFAVGEVYRSANDDRAAVVAEIRGDGQSGLMRFNDTGEVKWFLLRDLHRDGEWRRAE
jgi:hypothetical protein